MIEQTKTKPQTTRKIRIQKEYTNENFLNQSSNKLN